MSIPPRVILLSILRALLVIMGSVVSCRCECCFPLACERRQLLTKGRSCKLLASRCLLQWPATPVSQPPLQSPLYFQGFFFGDQQLHLFKKKNLSLRDYCEIPSICTTIIPPHISNRFHYKIKHVVKRTAISL
jgi:hypothetical protein